LDRSEAVTVLAGLLSHTDRARRWGALRWLGGQSVKAIGAMTAIVDHAGPVMAEMVAALDGDDPELQDAAIDVLDELNLPEALVALRAFLPRASAAQRQRLEVCLRYA
jgi:hypothetical protein